MRVWSQCFSIWLTSIEGHWRTSKIHFFIVQLFNNWPWRGDSVGQQHNCGLLEDWIIPVPHHQGYPWLDLSMYHHLASFESYLPMDYCSFWLLFDCSDVIHIRNLSPPDRFLILTVTQIFCWSFSPSSTLIVYRFTLYALISSRHPKCLIWSDQSGKKTVDLYVHCRSTLYINILFCDLLKQNSLLSFLLFNSSSLSHLITSFFFQPSLASTSWTCQLSCGVSSPTNPRPLRSQYIHTDSKYFWTLLSPAFIAICWFCLPPDICFLCFYGSI